ncbi:hypothetical protein [Leuconostoc citreum]|uniref:hypothetical protein n=1 Tax=Leuconostoc citreum TaxID=33964 RepID=UPI00030C8D2C|nr:hypothetical protein [Leuconostoc citreum]
MLIIFWNIFVFSILKSMPDWVTTWDWGNVADWVSGIGSFGALVFLIKQISDFKNERKDDREREFSKERPFFIMRIDDIDMNNKIYGSISLHHSCINCVPKNTIRIKNISNKPMLGVSCLLIKSSEKKEWEEIERYQVDKIDCDEIKYFASCYSYSKKYDLKILVYYHTAIRERTRLVFTIKAGNDLEYAWKKKQLENQHNNWLNNRDTFKKFNEEYDYHINNFVESEASNEPSA